MLPANEKQILGNWYADDGILYSKKETNSEKGLEILKAIDPNSGIKAHELGEKNQLYKTGQ